MLIALLLTTALCCWIVRRPLHLAGCLVLLLGSAVLVSALMAPPPARPSVAALRIELGGGEGRRIDLIHLQASPQAGWAGRVTWPRAGWLEVRGASLGADGQFTLAAGEDAWLIWQGAAEGQGPQERANRGAGWSLGYLRGRPDPKQVAYGWIPSLGVDVEASAACPRPPSTCGLGRFGPQIRAIGG